ncbi:hemerythrin domain-containing protein [Candidatus Thiothrix sp. Deng01]|uniref:Hemerythrin domain-containing protein n=1 Tax=Candidatus Thiothrix phosphatis TaxID=3112415 RepID=A0ABU6CRX5_9GAMM|nr:hemerythrin domain-containing protein [Candidatus Thiothrix sp. Deng01]MEB4589535.1 hemerythrin domain-containing protein [Candidatus Thiothrix sp. Deng01]
MTERNMQNLAQEHLECLQLADRLERIVQRGKSSELAEAVQWVREYNARELEPHLQHEEQTILAPLVQEHREHLPLYLQLGKEHGLLRTLAESITESSAQQDLAEFARVLRSHTLLEEQQLIPLMEALFTPEQWEAALTFTPLGHAPEAPLQPVATTSSTHPDAWLEPVGAHFQTASASNGHIVLFPRYQPELVERLAQHLGLEFFDYRAEVMSGLREKAGSLALEQLEQTLHERSRQHGLVCHNAEALLCVKPEAERREWLKRFAETDWPHPVVIPLTVFQADAPADSTQICDLELVRLPRHKTGAVSLNERLPYSV